MADRIENGIGEKFIGTFQGSHRGVQLNGSVFMCCNALNEFARVQFMEQDQPGAVERVVHILLACKVAAQNALAESRSPLRSDEGSFRVKLPLLNRHHLQPVPHIEIVRQKESEHEGCGQNNRIASLPQIPVVRKWAGSASDIV